EDHAPDVPALIAEVHEGHHDVGGLYHGQHDEDPFHPVPGIGHEVHPEHPEEHFHGGNGGKQDGDEVDLLADHAPLLLTVAGIQAIFDDVVAFHSYRRSPAQAFGLFRRSPAQASGSHQVEEGEHKDPDQVNEVPV